MVVDKATFCEKTRVLDRIYRMSKIIKTSLNIHKSFFACFG
jgi:hypothetical protein